MNSLRVSRLVRILLKFPSSTEGSRLRGRRDSIWWRISRNEFWIDDGRRIADEEDERWKRGSKERSRAIDDDPRRENSET